MNEFSFIDNTGWLKPFIIELHKYYKCSTSSEQSTERIATVSVMDANAFAIHSLNSVFRDDYFTILNEKPSWVTCLDRKTYDTSAMCRVSQGFGNRQVPIGKKFNPRFHNTEYNDILTLAKYSYNYLVHRTEIETILKTPSSDYTRFSMNTDDNIFNRLFMVNLRNNQKTDETKGSFDHILCTYNSKVQII